MCRVLWFSFLCSLIHIWIQTLWHDAEGEAKRLWNAPWSLPFLSIQHALPPLPAEAGPEAAPCKGPELQRREQPQRLPTAPAVLLPSGQGCWWDELGDQGRSSTKLPGANQSWSPAHSARPVCDRSSESLHPYFQ